jgi:hypothetical protein
MIKKFSCFSITHYFFAFIFFIALPSLSEAQEAAALSDSTKPVTVMLIPYDPLYYLSDADHDIAEQSKNEMKEVRRQFNLQSDYYVYAAVSKYFKCIDMLHDTSDAVQEDLVTIFSTLGYRYEDPMRLPADGHKPVPVSGKKETVEDPSTASHYQKPAPDLKYMNAVPNKPGLLKAMSDKYGAGYFVFINQFEIKTNYNSCLDIANKIYQRTILLHYSVYDRTGRQLSGNFAYSFFPTSSSEEKEIIRNSFAELGHSIAKSVAEAVYAGAAMKN